MLSTGTLFNQHYRVQRCIRAGGMGAVYEVLDERTRRRRALKVMLPSLTADPELRGRFSLEITVAANVDSEHIVEVLDAGIDAETQAPFYVMELLKGEDLATALERGPLSVEQTFVLLQQLSFALDRTHAQGIVHRDLKPGNLFVTLRDDGSLRLKILDFGIAKVATQATHDAKTTRSIGTPLYMSPEQVMGDGRIGPASDRYAMAHLAYTMLVGEAYFERDNAQGAVYQVLMRVVAGITDRATQRARESNMQLPPAFDAWFEKAAHRDPHMRYASSMDTLRGFSEVFGLELPAEHTIRLSEPGVQSSLRVSHAELATTQRFAVSPTFDSSLTPARSRPLTLRNARRFAFVLGALVLLGALLVFLLRGGPRADADVSSSEADNSVLAQSTRNSQPEPNSPVDQNSQKLAVATTLDEPTVEIAPSTNVAPSAAVPMLPQRPVTTAKRVSPRTGRAPSSARDAKSASTSSSSEVAPKPARTPVSDPTDIR